MNTIAIIAGIVGILVGGGLVFVVWNLFLGKTYKKTLADAEKAGEVHEPKEPSPISVTESGMIVVLHPTTKQFVSVSIMALQLSRLSYRGLLWETSIWARAGQSLNTPHSPISVTESGI